jgi:hypothetical protein
MSQGALTEQLFGIQEHIPPTYLPYPAQTDGSIQFNIFDKTLPSSLGKPLWGALPINFFLIRNERETPD